MEKEINHNIEINRIKNTQKNIIQHINNSRITEVIISLQHTPKYYEKIRTPGKYMTKTQEGTRMDKNTIHIIPFRGEKEKDIHSQENSWKQLESTDIIS